METNDLKKFVDVNREAFEIYEYQSGDWKSISEKLDQAKQAERNVVIPLKYLWRSAAVVLLTLGIGFYLSWSSWKEQNEVAMMSIELQEADSYYNDLIAIKVAEISKLDQTAEKEVFQNMKILDEAFSELKRDLKDNADNEEVIYAMIENYKIKLEILEQIIEQLEDRREL